MKTIFEKIIDKEIPAWVVYEDDKHLAFLTPFPNTPGLTILIPKKNPGDDAFLMPDSELAQLMTAAKKLVGMLKSGLGVKRVAMVIEGTGVPYVHVKLYPLSGDLAGEFSETTSHLEFYPQYAGYLTTVEGPKMSDEELKEIQQKITGGQE